MARKAYEHSAYWYAKTRGQTRSDKATHVERLVDGVRRDLRFDGNGNAVGRNGGVRGWLRENLPELSPKYKTLMRYKAMAIRLRQATGTKDPTPTSALLGDGADKADKTGRTAMRSAADAGSLSARSGNGAMHEGVRELLKEFRMMFSSLEEGLRRRLDPDQVFLDPAKPRRATARAEKRDSARTRRESGESEEQNHAKPRRETARRNREAARSKGKRSVSENENSKRKIPRDLSEGNSRKTPSE